MPAGLYGSRHQRLLSLLVNVVKPIQRLDRAADINAIVLFKAKLGRKFHHDLAFSLDRNHAALIFFIQLGLLRMLAGKLRRRAFDQLDMGLL